MPQYLGLVKLLNHFLCTKCACTYFYEVSSGLFPNLLLSSRNGRDWELVLTWSAIAPKRRTINVLFEQILRMLWWLYCIAQISNFDL